MTLCLGWIREVEKTRELCLASDSCLSGGDRFYAAPKLFMLKRGDCAFACAGATNYFYPIAEHIVRAIDLNQPINDRAIDFTDLKHNILDILKTLPIGFIHYREDDTRYITYMGRPLLDYETFPYPMIDLRTWKTKYMKATLEEFKREHEELKDLDVFYKRH